MINLISVTWSFDDTFNFEDTRLYRSFIKNNPKENFYNIHFNRNNYLELENNFKERFNNQYEFLLYRIFLLKDEISKLNYDTIIFSDTNDVVCLDNLNRVNFNNYNKIIFSSEKHRYPNESSITNWEPTYKYNYENEKNNFFLNAGLSLGKKETFISLFNECIENVFPKGYKNFGGDQGVFTYYYINNENNIIILDTENEYFLSTYSCSQSNFLYKDGKIKNIKSNRCPIFVHDNGWNYGSPKFIEHFNLI